MKTCTTRTRKREWEQRCVFHLFSPSPGMTSCDVCQRTFKAWSSRRNCRQSEGGRAEEDVLAKVQQFKIIRVKIQVLYFFFLAIFGSHPQMASYMFIFSDSPKWWQWEMNAAFDKQSKDRLNAITWCREELAVWLLMICLQSGHDPNVELQTL